MKRAYQIGCRNLVMAIVIIGLCSLQWLTPDRSWDSLEFILICLSLIGLAFYLIGSGVIHGIKFWKKEKWLALLPLGLAVSILSLIFFAFPVCTSFTRAIFFPINFTQYDHVVKIMDKNIPAGFVDSYALPIQYRYLSRYGEVLVTKEDQGLTVTFALGPGNVVEYSQADRWAGTDHFKNYAVSRNRPKWFYGTSNGSFFELPWVNR